MKSIINKVSPDQISQKLHAYFGMAEDVAHQTKFVQRKSPLNGEAFLKILVFGFLQKPTASLNYLAQQGLNLGIKISPQGIDERITSFAVTFLQTMFVRAFDQFRNSVSLPLSSLTQFSAIYLVDSTFKTLPSGMEHLYPGSGGKSSCASLKVQLVFDFLSGNMTQLTVQAGRMADQAYTQYLEVVGAGSLVIADLGYFCLDSLKTVIQKGAYFLTRYHYPTGVFDADGKTIDLLVLLQSHPTTELDLGVWVGASIKKRLPCRLIAFPVCQGVAEERRRKAKCKAATHGKTLTAAYLTSLGWSTFLTNVPSPMLPTCQVRLFYRIRWQIELIFKFWKSGCGLDTIPAIRSERVLTELYAKLLVGLIANYLIAPIRIPEEVWVEHEISPFKLRDCLSIMAQRLMLALSSISDLTQIIQTFFQSAQSFGLKQKRRHKPNLLASLADLQAPPAP
jgi:hypothetical protein